MIRIFKISAENGANNAKVDYENNVLSLLDQDYIAVSIFTLTTLSLI